MAIIAFLHRWYKYLISPMLGNNCRFHPDCSDYALQAFEQHGVLRGFLLSAWRVIRCTPFSRGGLDPVPRVNDK